jgi:pyruvate dehydrogenase E1 component beta subunit
MVVLAMTGAGWGVGGQHNHNLEAMFVHAPGLKVVMPSTPADFKGLLKAAIRDPNPVLFFVDLALVGSSGPVPPGDAAAPLGRAELRRPGDDLTLVGYGKTVGICLQAADELAAGGIDAEVIDLRCLKPLDAATVLGSVRRTGRLLVVHEAAAPCGLGAELMALASEHAFSALKAPPARLTGPDAPAAASWVLEQAGVPQVQSVVRTAQRLVRHGATQAVPA